MNCIKCGREIKEPQVFCDSCLTDMKKYPVKPNVTIQLPARPAETPAKKKPHRQKYTKPEDQTKHLKFLLRWISVALVAVLIAFAVTAAMLLKVLEDRDEQYSPGQNYGTMSSTDGT